MTKKRRIIIVTVLLIIAILGCLLVYENKNIELNTFEIMSEDLPAEFDGYCIAHISDFHNTKFGKDNAKLINMLKEADPDIIAITGDIIDSRRTDIDVSFTFVEEILKIAPCYYVTGNHEARVSEEYTLLKEKMAQAGVIILENDCLSIEREATTIEIIGLEDPTFRVIGSVAEEAEVVSDVLPKLTTSDDNFRILLSHKPEFFDIYVESDIDLVLSGHAHGGQFIIPLIGGLIAPGQGLFPELDSGLFEKDETILIVSRGIGNSVIPLRINNRPEIILIDLHSAG